MRVVYHPDVQQDVSRILRHYDGINAQLGDEFWEELQYFISRAAANPRHFHFKTPDRRRVNLKRFPFHFLFRETTDGIRITVVRHNRQHPERGRERR